jgi:spermidine synthase
MLGLYLVVALSGACVLVIEILGTRILGPFYGVSLYLWSALISVALASLSVGYAVGGRWADRHPSATVLARILALAGIWMLAVPWLRDPILRLTEPLGLRAAVLVTSTLLFAPPLTLLGMVSPFAIRLKLEDVARAGRTAGDLYAVSTVASVLGAVATGFWLAPNVGVTRLVFAIGATLLVAAAIAAGLGGARRPRTAWAALLLAALAGWGAATVTEASAPGLVHVEDSPYAELRVLDRGGRRHLVIDGGIHTQIDSLSRRPWLSYVPLAAIPAELYPRGSRVLVVGLGGGSAARFYAGRGWQVDAVEIDPAVTAVARRWFDFGPADGTVHHADGRRFLVTSRAQWEVIFMDAFGSGAIPFHLITREAFAAAKARLAPGGMLALNVESVGWQSPLIRAVMATLRAEFPHVVALPIAEPPDQIGNLVLLASARPIDVSYEALGDPVAALVDVYEHWWVVTRNHAWDNRFVADPAWGPVLTDDLNPVDLWAEETNRVARQALHKTFAAGGSW